MTSKPDKTAEAKRAKDQISDEDLEKVSGGMGDNMPGWAQRKLDALVASGWSPGDGSN